MTRVIDAHPDKAAAVVRHVNHTLLPRLAASPHWPAVQAVVATGRAAAASKEAGRKAAQGGGGAGAGKRKGQGGRGGREGGQGGRQRGMGGKQHQAQQGAVNGAGVGEGAVGAGVANDAQQGPAL